MDNSSNYVGTATTPYSQVNQVNWGVCPGCGRCNVCGRGGGWYNLPYGPNIPYIVGPIYTTCGSLN